ncbi:ATP-binding cassette domain-containing protein [Actinospica robiniae]|uniref:ATP-binding cassette domain-containing protein n=1 Tax=Actinospica robiniae TaxID=304901 RepID=UPI0012FCB521
MSAVDEVDLKIESGSVLALTGPSGSGKSTLLHLLGAIERADAGTIRVGEVEVTAARRGALADYRASVGFVFQRFHLLPALTARDNVLAPLLARRGDRAAQRRRADELLDAVGLGGRGNSLPSQLSGGQQQRIAIARALIGAPVLLLADEPTGNLDSATGKEIVDLLIALNEEHGMTMVIATHDLGIAASCGRAIAMLDGRIVSDTSGGR